MGKKFFDDDENGVSYQDVTISSEDVLDTNEDAIQALADTHEAETDLSLYKSGLEKRDVLEKHVELYTGILSKDNVASDTVLVAQSSLESICVELGASSDYYDISVEDINDTPRMALQMALESSEGVLTGLIAKLKKFVEFIARSISKATLSVMTAMSRVEKSADGFIKTLDSSDKKGDLNDGVKGYPDGIAKGIKSKFGTVIATMGKGSNLTKGDLDKMVSGVKQIKGNFKQLQNIDKDKLKGGLGKINFMVVNGSSVYTSPNKYFPNFPAEYIGAQKFVTRYDGTMGRMALFLEKDGKTKVTYFEGTVKNDQYAKAKLDNIIAYGDLTKLAEDAKDIAKDMKDIKSEGDKALAHIKKLVGDIRTEDATAVSTGKTNSEKEGADKAEYKDAKDASKSLLNTIDAFVHTAPKAILDSTWMAYRTSASLLWLAQKTYGLYK